MPPWVSRGLGLAVLHAAATIAVAKLAVFRPTDITVVTIVVLALLVGSAALWSALDAWLGLDRAARNWFIAGLITGPLSGVLAVIGRAVFVDQTGLSALGSALTGGAAFTALLVLIPAGLGVLVGTRIRTNRDEEPTQDSGVDPSLGPVG